MLGLIEPNYNAGHCIASLSRDRGQGPEAIPLLAGCSNDPKQLNKNEYEYPLCISNIFKTHHGY